MKILVSGSHGFIGQHLVRALNQIGHQACPLIRTNRIARRGQIVWNPVDEYIQHARLDNIDAVIHLAGENIVGRWTVAKKKKIYSSRVFSTRFLAQSIAQLNPAPKIMLSASAIGYYGDRADEQLTETSPPGIGFLANLCNDWEAACKPAEDAGIRVVNMRFGMVLDKSGGALAKMLPAFKYFIGGPLAGGGQWQSWISIPDCIRAILYLLEHDTISGPVNLTAPEPVQNRTFTAALAKSLKRPAKISAPAWTLKMLYGQMAQQVLLASARVIPQKIQEHSFVFTHPSLEIALPALLQK